MLIDSHAHIDFYDDPEAVLARAHAAGVGSMLAIGIGDGPSTMHRALDFARTHASVFASAGIHPQEAHQATPENLALLAELASDPKCIAIGEIGLDYYHLDNPDIPTQKAAFVAQMKVAAAARKPILIHCRTSELAKPEAKAKYEPADAWDDLLALIAEHWTPTGLPGVMHCFSGSPEQGRLAVAAGFYLSFAGNLTYPSAVGIRQAAVEAPADRILVETDSPFLAPIPHRGQTNEPAFVVHTAAALAELRDLSPEKLAQLTTTNFRTLFPTTQN
ncbi:TatD family deoxyribonuclease [Granulicella sp. WH15]|uniref:TatD family hydrolase n=1 Tax=Granulicella sp. WH15 TaxID=2602070 RepID=UPI001367207E|nr:TatD family hydrolase [Granulicella sp. WH15]QHN03104.1 TatD family deoxyribonuclease [Granulicella sp. WH15]